MSRVLIVEDEEAIAEIEKDYLELSDFEVVIKSDGTQGLATALNEDFDIMILDVMLPGTDGYEICRQVREVKNTPIIMVSAKKEDIDKIRGLPNPPVCVVEEPSEALIPSSSALIVISPLLITMSFASRPS